MREEIRERKKNNKGFSLVELIIVIAIMAILVAILAPQFLKYVERSRNTADIANAREISNAIIAYIADTELDVTIPTGDVTIEVNDKQTTVDNELYVKALHEAGITTATSSPINDVKCKSKTSWTKYLITVGVDDKGTVTFKYEAKDGKNTQAFADAFQQNTGSSGSSGSGSGGTTGGDSGSTGGDTGTGDSTGGNTGG